jgi:Mn2+/Fe2+ NRAMP family transporter
MYSLIFSWIITIIIESVIFWLFIREEPLKLLFTSFLVNSVTLPLATFSYLYFYPNYLLTETAVFLAEGVLLKSLLEIDYSKALLISLVANMVTMIVGFFI